MCYHYCNCIQIILHIHSVIMFNYSVNCTEIYIYDKLIVMYVFIKKDISDENFLFVLSFYQRKNKKNIKNIGINKYGLW